MRTEEEWLHKEQEWLQREQNMLEMIKQQQETITVLQQQVQSLQQRLDKDSHNSHLPPSSDRWKRQPKSLRPKSGKKPGGQFGHPGNTLMQVETPDQIFMHTPQICPECQHHLDDAPVIQVEKRQVVDIPAPRALFLEHRVLTKLCPHCDHLVSASFPQDVVAPIQYGPTFSALVIYLAQYHLVPNERLSHLLHDLCGLSMSVGTIQNMIARCARHLEPFERSLKAALQQSPVMHQDESGLYVQGQRYWAHVSATHHLTHYGVHRKRGREAMDALGIAPGFAGIGVHDGWESYQGYLYQHALCNVHHLRELTFIEETFGQPWARDLKTLLLEMKAHTEQARHAGQSDVSPLLRQSLVRRYEALIEQGYQMNPPDPPPEQTKRGKRKQHPARCLLDRLDQRQEQVLAFLYHLHVPFDNSLAERDIRMLKVQQKISGCFRAETGARDFCRIRSYVSTLRKQGFQLLTALELTFAGHPVLPTF